MPKSALNGSDVAVVVTTYNRPNALSWVLASLFEQSVMPALIIVADDGSGTDTGDLVQVWASHFKQHSSRTALVHAWQEDLGFRAAAARNLAVQHAQEFGSIRRIIFLDGDCVAPSFFIQNHLTLLAPNLMVAGGRGLLSENHTNSLEEFARGLPPEMIVPELRQFSSPYRLWRAKACDRCVAMQPFTYTALNTLRDLRPKDDSLVRSCNLAVWLEDFIKVKGFDESFLGWGLEDTEFAVRLISAGVAVRYGRFATNVFHLWHPERNRSALESNSERLRLARAAARGIGG